MTLEELQKEKKELEQRIGKLINDFSEKYNASISQLKVSQDNYESLGREQKTFTTNIKIVIEL